MSDHANRIISRTAKLKTLGLVPSDVDCPPQFFPLLPIDLLTHYSRIQNTDIVYLK